MANKRQRRSYYSLNREKTLARTSTYQKSPRGRAKLAERIRRYANGGRIVRIRKVCPKCHQRRKANKFSPSNQTIDGLQGWCRDCNRRLMTEQRRTDPVGTMLKWTKSAAKKKGLNFELTRKDIVIPAKCPLLGITLVSGFGTGRPNDNSPSLDRINNELGYISGNVWIISHKANRIKNNATLEEVETVLSNWKKFLHDR